MDAYQLWQATLGRLELQLASPTYDTWLNNTNSVSCEDGVLVVGVRSAYAKDWLENRLYGLIHSTVSDIAARTMTVRFIVQRSSVSEPEQVSLLNRQTLPEVSADQMAGDYASSRLNPKYTFDTFIVGHSTRLAHAGCQAVAEQPGVAYNPLFIYGGVGLGKTHLLHAIGNHVVERGGNALYVSAETFANEMINGIRSRTNEQFRARYRTIGVLLLDDTQFLINKERTQEEFFHTFNDLHQDNRQIVISSDRPPKAFVGLEERLRSRFEWGLIADVQPPDLETRMAILGAKVDARGVRMPNEVIEFIAHQVRDNIRELEGALNRVLAVSRMMGYPLTVQTAERALGDVMRSTTKVTMDDVMAVVAAHFELRVDDLTGPRRNRHISRPRHIAMYLVRDLTSMSFPQIGQSLGGRDHTTILHGYNKIRALFEKDDEVRRQVLEIKAQLAGAEFQRAPARARRQGVRRS